MQKSVPNLKNIYGKMKSRYGEGNRWHILFKLTLNNSSKMTR